VGVQNPAQHQFTARVDDLYIHWGISLSRPGQAASDPRWGFNLGGYYLLAVTAGREQAPSPAKLSRLAFGFANLFLFALPRPRLPSAIPSAWVSSPSNMPDFLFRHRPCRPPRFAGAGSLNEDFCLTPLNFLAMLF
jgi:hypothetical protein